jgi:broad specificity phosphatase PhoE
LTTNKTIYLIRHGQTDFNLRRIVQGSGIDSDLNETGRKQAQQFFEAYGHIPFDHIYTSELKRTHQSVEAFINTGMSWSILSELNEINWGIYEGLETTPASKQAFNNIVESWSAGELEKPISGGESPIEMYNRQVLGWDKICQSSHERILICMHGRAMRSFLSLILQTNLSDMDQYPHTNLCLYQIEEIENSAYEIRLKNDVRHLQVGQTTQS